MPLLLCLKIWVMSSDLWDRVEWKCYRSTKLRDCVLMSILPIIIGCASAGPDLKVYSTEEIKPVSVSEFILGPGDVIAINVWRYDDLNYKLQVDPYGRIYYPFVGDIEATGKSVITIREAIVKGLSEYFVNPVVNVSVVSIQSQKVFVLGEVSNPGILSMDRPMTVLEAIAHSGGFTRDAKKENVLIVRSSKSPAQLYKLDIASSIDDGDMQQNIALQNGDIIIVPALIMADVARYARYISDILSPIIQIETGIVLGDDVNNVIEGTRGNSGDRTIIIQANP